MSWTDIAALDDIPVRGARIVKTQAGCIAVFRTGDNEVFATSDRLPSQGWPPVRGHRAWEIRDLPAAQLGVQLGNGRGSGR